MRDTETGTGLGDAPAADWWQGFFDDRYRLSDLERQDDSVSRRQVGCVIDSLELAEGARVLDLACGTGRHSIRLAELGFDVVGVDLNDDYLRRAREDAQRLGVRAEFVQADMRDLHVLPDEHADAVISMHTSFGFFHDPRENRRVLGEIGRVLVPGGRAFIDVMNRDWLLKTFAQSEFASDGERFVVRDYDDRGDEIVLHEDSFDPRTSMHTWTITRLTEPKGSITAVWRIYSLHELIDLVTNEGLRFVRALGNYDGAPFDLSSPRIICVVERP
jgi:ubiquinone/menaquinone biosynthesis C-methylase UbiE